VVNIDRSETTEGALYTVSNQDWVLFLDARLWVTDVKTGGLDWGWGFVT
jgi:hypothetical protein